MSGARTWDRNFSAQLRAFTEMFLNDLEKCLQCGKCVGTCPAARISSYNSRKLIRDIRRGKPEKVIASEELWICFLCGACYAVCPRDINFPFTILLLRATALQTGYGYEHVKKLLPYGWNYYQQGLAVSVRETNPTVSEAVAHNSGTDGTIGEVRKRIGLSSQRVVSRQALTEVQFLADITGITGILENF